MHIVFDPAKDDANIASHGVSLELAARIDWPEVLVGVDDRRDYGELREIGYALIDARLYCVVFTQRAAILRIISLRKANNREIDRYEEQVRNTEERSGGRSGNPARHRSRSGNVYSFR
jgi:uncharacterized protein